MAGLRTPRTELRRAVWTVDGSALSRHTAARIHGLTSSGDRGIDLVAPLSAHHPSNNLLRIHRTGHLPGIDLTVVNGLTVTTVPRTLCDLAALLWPSRLQNLVERAVTSGLCTLGEVDACRSAYVRRGRVGSARLNETLDLLVGRPIATRTPIERLLRSILGSHHIEGFAEQYQPPWYDGMRGVVDVAVPDARLVIEADSRRWHSTTQAMTEDRRRDRLAQRHGWVVLRFTWQELQHRPGAVGEEIAMMIDARRHAEPA